MTVCLTLITIILLVSMTAWAWARLGVLTILMVVLIKFGPLWEPAFNVCYDLDALDNPVCEALL